MRYRIKYMKGGAVVHTTHLRWPFNSASGYWEKNGEQAEICCENGIPF